MISWALFSQIRSCSVAWLDGNIVLFEWLGGVCGRLLCHGFSKVFLSSSLNGLRCVCVSVRCFALIGW